MKHFSHNFFVKICLTNSNWPFVDFDYNSDTSLPIHYLLGLEWIDVESFALFDHGHKKCQILVRQKNWDLSLLKFESSVLDMWYIVLIWTNCTIFEFVKMSFAFFYVSKYTFSFCFLLFKNVFLFLLQP
jgi:hypothetical protein